MPKELPYLPSYKNVGALFDRIEKAKIPDAFNLNFLANTIGLKGSGDRQLIGLLKKLGFLDNAGKPTPEYSLLKNKAVAKTAIGSAIRRAYAPLYDADESAHDLPNDKLKGLIAQVSGADEKMNQLITGTFNALHKTADFKPVEQTNLEIDEDGVDEGTEPEETTTPQQESKKTQEKFSPAGTSFSPDFRVQYRNSPTVEWH